MRNLNSESHRTTASGNDLSTTSIVNHIYLTTNSDQNAFRSGMERNDAVLHLASDQISFEHYLISPPHERRKLFSALHFLQQESETALSEF